MAGDATTELRPRRALPRWLVYLLVLGFYLSLRGYHSFDGDQAYRLPLLLHQQNPQIYADDPFVQAFEQFNPHRGALLVLDVVSRAFGLPAGLFILFLLTFVATCLSAERLACSAWPAAGDNVGLLAVGLVLAAKAGNIGTNHLFEAMVLDRLIAFSLGWLALASMVAGTPREGWRPPVAIGVATLIHPSVGLQLAMLLCACWVAWSLLGRWSGIRFKAAIGGVAGLVVGVLPGLAVNFARSSSVVSNMPADVFWLLSVELQSPQHMLPHLWRMPQWLAWSSYLALAGVGCATADAIQATGRSRGSTGRQSPLPWPQARLRLVIALAIILVGLALAWLLIEVRHNVRVTVFQPFRMATVARGIALVLVAGRLIALWQSGAWSGRTRAIVMAIGFVGDWLLVVVTISELAVSIVEAIRPRIPWFKPWNCFDGAVWATMLALGLNFLGHHDTEYGHLPLLSALGAGCLVEILRGLFSDLRDGESVISRAFGPSRVRWFCRTLTPPPHPPFGHPLPRGAREIVGWTPLRLGGALALAWMVPVAAALAALLPASCSWSRHPVVTSLLNRCRFMQVPVDDVERVALWCQENTPATARFIGPPGPKTFRLWSQRNLAFNRAASPYHAAGLADWYARFQDHVDFHVAPAEFVQAYVCERHKFEARYQALTDTQRAALAVRQGATYVIAAAPARLAHADGVSSHLEPKKDPERLGPLELLHIEGRYAVYRVKLDALVQRQE
jgi:hypothetical protein